MTTEEYISKERLEALKVELEELTTVKRREIAEKLEETRALGDLSENAEYHDARDEQADIEDRIKYLEHTIKTAKVISSTKKKSSEVSLGSTVEIRKKGAKKTIEYTIVGSEESNISEGKISFHSPLGEALFGRAKGEKVSFETPSGVQEYTIVSIK